MSKHIEDLARFLAGLRSQEEGTDPNEYDDCLTPEEQQEWRDHASRINDWFCKGDIRDHIDAIEEHYVKALGNNFEAMSDWELRQYGLRRIE